MIDLRQVISREEMDILFHDNDIGRRVVTDEGDMIMVQVWLGIYEVSEKYIEYQDNEDYGYFYGTFTEMLTVLVDTDIIRFYKNEEHSDYPTLDEDDISYLKSVYRDELDRATTEIKKQCGPFQLYYNKEKVSLFQKIYFNPAGGLCRKGTLEYLLRFIDKMSSSGIKIQDFIDWMGLEETYIFYNWEFLIFAIGYSTPENIAKMFAYFARFMTDNERENFHFELLAEKNVVYDNSMSQFKGKFQNYYYRIEETEDAVEQDAIDSFMEEIDDLKLLASEGVLESSKQSDLITRMRSYRYEEITDNVVFLLKVKKLLRSSTQTIFTDRHGGFSNAIHQFLQDWDNLFREFKGKKESEAKIVENEKEGKIKIDIGELSNILRIDSNTGNVYQGKAKICELTPDTAPYKFVKYLFEHEGELVRYDALKKEVNDVVMATTDAKYCQKIKNSLDSRIKKHIKPKGVGFIFEQE